jgi:outer membrane lipoprotein SlyB
MKSHLAKFAAVLLTTAFLGAGWMYASGQYNDDRYNNDRYNNQRYSERGRWSRNQAVRAGTPIDVRLDTRIATDDNNAGDGWSGVVARDVMNSSGRRVIIPAGTPVEGVVTVSEQGRSGVKGRLDLAVRSIQINGDVRRMNASTEPIIDGSKQAKKIGAVIGGAAVGGLLGHAIGGDKGSILGGLLGGAAGYGATRHSGRTVTVRPGTVITFTTTTDMLAYR